MSIAERYFCVFGQQQMVPAETVQSLLEQTWFSGGHIGQDQPSEGFADIFNWTLERLSLAQIIQPEQQGELIRGLEREEQIEFSGEQFKFYDDPIVIADSPSAEHLRLANGMYLFDGSHRLVAALRMRKRTIMAYVGRLKPEFEGINEE
jgi:hypothetical protein